MTFDFPVLFPRMPAGVVLLAPHEDLSRYALPPTLPIRREIAETEGQASIADRNPAPPPDPALAKERQALAAMLENLDRLGDDLRGQQVQRLHEMQKVAIELALAVASQLVRKEIARGEFPIDKIVSQVVEQLDPRQAATVFVHPADLELLEARAEQHGSDIRALNPDIRLVADPAVSRGDCRAETGDLTIAARLEDQLTAMRADLFETLPDVQVERRQARPTSIRRFPDRRQTA